MTINVLFTFLRHYVTRHPFLNTPPPFPIPCCILAATSDRTIYSDRRHFSSTTHQKRTYHTASNLISRKCNTVCLCISVRQHHSLVHTVCVEFVQTNTPLSCLFKVVCSAVLPCWMYASLLQLLEFPNESWAFIRLQTHIECLFHIYH